jgi:arabinose-5-phosphate isomerase
MNETGTTQPTSPVDREPEAAFIADALRAEAEAILAVAERLEGPDATRWGAAVDLIAECDGHLVVTGMGKSGLIGAKISSTFSSLGQPSTVLHPAEAVHGDLGRIRRGDVVMLLSFSGQTDEVVNLAALLRADGVRRLGVSRDDGSALATLCDVHLSLGHIARSGWPRPPRRPPCWRSGMRWPWPSRAGGTSTPTTSSGVTPAACSALG